MSHALYLWLLNTGASVALHCSYYWLLLFLLNFGVPQSLSHGQYIAQSFLILHLSINCVLPLVTLGFPRLILFYFLVSCCY